VDWKREKLLHFNIQFKLFIAKINITKGFNASSAKEIKKIKLGTNMIFSQPIIGA
jgi:hypothetical protein